MLYSTVELHMSYKNIDVFLVERLAAQKAMSLLEVVLCLSFEGRSQAGHEKGWIFGVLCAP